MNSNNFCEKLAKIWDAMESNEKGWTLYCVYDIILKIVEKFKVSYTINVCQKAITILIPDEKAVLLL